MLKTLGVFVAGVLSAMTLLAGGVYLIAYVIPQQFDPYFYVLLMASIGIIVGTVVGVLQPPKAELVTVICLLVPLLLEIRRLHVGQQNSIIIVFIFGQILELTLGFVIARRLSAG